MAAKHREWLARGLDAAFAYRLPQQLMVLLYKNGAHWLALTPTYALWAAAGEPTHPAPLLRSPLPLQHAFEMRGDGWRCAGQQHSHMYIAEPLVW